MAPRNSNTIGAGGNARRKIVRGDVLCHLALTGRG